MNSVGAIDLKLYLFQNLVQPGKTISMGFSLLLQSTKFPEVHRHCRSQGLNQMNIIIWMLTGSANASQPKLERLHTLSKMECNWHRNGQGRNSVQVVLGMWCFLVEALLVDTVMCCLDSSLSGIKTDSQLLIAMAVPCWKVSTSCQCTCRIAWSQCQLAWGHTLPAVRHPRTI